jgi:hypothetical protein
MMEFLCTDVDTAFDTVFDTAFDREAELNNPDQA